MSPKGPLALRLLLQGLEDPAGQLHPAGLAAEQVAPFKLLTESRALVAAQGAPAMVVCPGCAEFDLAPEHDGHGLRGLCPACGYVRLASDYLQRWQADVDWLLTKLRRALGMEARQLSQTLLDGRIWKVGDVGQKKQRRRVFLARRLTEPRALHQLRTIVGNNAERGMAVIVGTRARDQVDVGESSFIYMPLDTLFHWRSGGLHLDQSLWDWCLKPLHIRNHPGSRVFSEDFRTAIIDGEEYTFSDLQSQCWEILVAADGAKQQRDWIMAQIDSSQPNPRALFRHNPRQLAAFDRLVESDDEGFYWLKSG